MMKYLSLIVLCLFISGCSYLSNKFESLTQTKQDAAKNISNTSKNNYCPADSKTQYISEDEALLKYYKNLNPLIIENRNISFVQRAVMFSLIEMVRRPDVASPYARFQVYLKTGGKSYYFDFRPKKLEDDTRMSYLKGLEVLTAKFIPGQNLNTIAASLDNTVPVAVNVSNEFEKYLSENKNDIAKNDTLSSYFLKGDEALTRYETFNRISFKSLIQYYQSSFSKNSDYEYEINGLTANKSESKTLQTNCNYDLSVESSLKDEMIPSELKKAHITGLSDGDDYFLSVSSATPFKPFKTTPKLGYFMKSRPSPLPLPVCEIKGSAQEIVLLSTDGRNPVQHLQHLLSYGIEQATTAYSLNELLNFSRHLFLSNPDRILYESKRGRKAQLDFFLSMNFPIYHVESLGNLFGHSHFIGDKKAANTLHIDDRSQARLWCK